VAGGRAGELVNPEISVHPELRSVKAHVLPTSPWVLGAMQAFLRLVNRLHRRRFHRILTRSLIPGTDGHLVPVLIIRPEQPRPPTPALVYFHGGAFVMEGAPAHVENAVRYAREVGCTVIFVDYRLAPRHVFPAGFNDCYAALKWAIANAGTLGIDANRVAIGGDSAGGNLAVSVAQRAAFEDGIALKGLLLLYPAVDLVCDRPSMTLFRDVPPFKGLSAAGVAQLYLGHAPAAPLPRYASPAEGPRRGLPPTYVELPQFDPLHDQGAAYAQALRDDGVEVELNEVAGGIHGFDLMAPRCSLTQQAIARRVHFLSGIFAA
jgi:acetyl esterase/lipase